jgi:hypothetical protein
MTKDEPVDSSVRHAQRPSPSEELCRKAEELKQAIEAQKRKTNYRSSNDSKT